MKIPEQPQPYHAIPGRFQTSAKISPVVLKLQQKIVIAKTALSVKNFTNLSVVQFLPQMGHLTGWIRDKDLGGDCHVMFPDL